MSLVGSFVLMLHPLRHCVMEVLLGSSYHTTKHAKVRGIKAAAVTCVLLFVTCVCCV